MRGKSKCETAFVFLGVCPAQLISPPVAVRCIRPPRCRRSCDHVQRQTSSHQLSLPGRRDAGRGLRIRAGEGRRQASQGAPAQHVAQSAPFQHSSAVERVHRELLKFFLTAPCVVCPCTTAGDLRWSRCAWRVQGAGGQREVALHLLPRSQEQPAEAGSVQVRRQSTACASVSPAEVSR